MSIVRSTAKGHRRQRRFPRYPYDVHIQISVFREVGITRYSGRCTDLSLHGLGLILSGELQVADVVSVDFPIPVQPLLMKLRGVVRYKRGLQYGVEFLVVDDEQQQALREVCAMLANTSPTKLLSRP